MDTHRHIGRPTRGAPARRARAFLRQQLGFEGAEKALLICFGLAIVVLIGVLLQGGSQKAARDAERVLSTASGTSAPLGQAVGPMQAGDVQQPGASSDAPAATPAPPPKDEGPGFFGQVGGFFKGLYEGGKDTVVGLVDLGKGAWSLTGGWIFNPEGSKQTWENLKGTVSTIWNDPGKVWDAIKEPYVSAWREGRYGEAIGRGTFEIVTAVLGTKGLDKAGKAGKLAEVGGDLGKVRKLEEAADLGKVGKLEEVGKAGKLEEIGKAGKLEEAGQAGKVDEAGKAGKVEPPRTIRVPTAEERVLAAQAGDTLAQQAARRLVAEDYYVNQAGWPAKRAASHLDGIDWSKPVRIVDIPPGKLDQWVANGKVGNYFAPRGTPAGELGINPQGRVVQTFDIPPGSRGLQSTAAEIVDTWTDPARPYKAKGGGTQIFVSDAQRDAIIAYNRGR